MPVLGCLLATPRYRGVELLTQTFLDDTHLCGESTVYSPGFAEDSDRIPSIRAPLARGNGEALCGTGEAINFLGAVSAAILAIEAKPLS